MEKLYYYMGESTMYNNNYALVDYSKYPQQIISYRSCCTFSNRDIELSSIIKP